MKKPVLLVLNILLAAQRATIAEHFDIVDGAKAQRADAIAARGAEVQVVLTVGAVGLTAAEMDAMPRLELVCTLGVGYEMVDVAHARAKGIALGNVAGANDDAVADHAMALLLSAVRCVTQYDKAARAGVERFALAPPMQVTRKRVGILGMGAIGRKIAERCGGFGMQVGYHNRKPRTDVPATYAYYPDALALAAWCDFFILAAPGGAETRHVAGTRLFDALGPRGYIVNIARGSLVDTDALADALRDKRIAGAALDVFESEPELPAQLLEFPQVVITPHVAGRSPESVEETVARFLANAEGHFAGRGVLYPI
ncbi:MAG: 2-hydroxyacid dehydrogenase [Pseudomonadota bacterium]